MLRYQCGLIRQAPHLPLTIPIGKKIFSCELESEVVFSPNPRILDAKRSRYGATPGDCGWCTVRRLMALAWACLMLGVFGRHRVFLVLALTVTIIAGFEIALRGYGQFYIWPTCRRGTIAIPQSWAPLALGLVVFGGMLGRHSKALARFRRCWQAWAPCMDLPLSWQLSAPSRQPASWRCRWAACFS